MNDKAPKFSKLWPKSRKGFAVAQRLCKNYAAHYDRSSRRRLKRSSTYYVPTTKETHPCAVQISGVQRWAKRFCLKNQKKLNLLTCPINANNKNNLKHIVDWIAVVE